MVRIGDIDPGSLMTVSAAELAQSRPIAAPAPAVSPGIVSAADLRAAVPVGAGVGEGGDTISLSDLRGSAPLSIDQELALEGRRYWNNRTAVGPVPDPQRQLLEPDARLYATHFASQPGGVESFGALGDTGVRLADADKQKLLRQLQRANTTYEMAAPATNAGILPALAAEEAAHTGQTATGVSQFAHGMSGVANKVLVDPALDLLGRPYISNGAVKFESDEDARGRMRADQAFQQAQAAQHPITAAVGKGLGSLAAPESLAAMAITGGVGAGLAPVSTLGKWGLVAGEGGAYGGTVMPGQRMAEGEPVTLQDVGRDIAVGSLGAVGGKAVGKVVGAVTAKAAPAVQGAAQFGAGAATSGAINVGAGYGSAKMREGGKYELADAVRDFIAGSALHVPGGVPEAVETMRAARDRIAAADPKNSAVVRLDAEIARHALEVPHEQSPDRTDGSGGAGGQVPDAVGGGRVGPGAAPVVPVPAVPQRQPEVVGEAPAAAAPAETPSAPEVPQQVVPRRVSDLANVPDYVRDEINRHYAAAENAGVVDAIEASAAARNTAKQTAMELGEKLPGATLGDKINLVRSVRAKLEIPSLDDRPEFDSWLSSRAQEQPRPVPPAAAQISTFKTAQGSSYVVDAEGRTTRAKSAHVGHDPADVGQKQQSEKTVYVDELASRAIGMQGQVQGSRRGMVENDGRLYPVAWNAAENRWGVAPSSRGGFEFSHVPEVGKHPIELWEGRDGDQGREYGKWHAGNAITELGAAPVETQSPAAYSAPESSGDAHAQANTSENTAKGLGGGGSVPPRGERPGGQPAQGERGDLPDAGQGASESQRRAKSIAGIRKAIEPFSGVTLHDDGAGNLHLRMPDGKRVRWDLVDQLDVPADLSSNYLRSAHAANDGKSEFTYQGRSVRLPADEAEWAQLSEADRAAVKDKFRFAGSYNRSTDTITTSHRVGDNPRIGSEEVFHAQAERLRQADVKTYQRMLERYGNEDLAFRAFIREGAKGSPRSRGIYFERIRRGSAHLPAPQGYIAPRERAAAKLLLAAQNDGVLMSDAEFEAFRNDMGGLHPDVLKDYQVRGRDGKVVIDKKTGKPKLTAEGKALAMFVDEGGFSNATADMDPRQIEQYQDRVISELLMSREQKIQTAAEHYNNPNAMPELRKAAEKILGRPAITDDDIPFATEKKDENQLTLAGELQGRATVGGTGKLFGAAPEEPRLRSGGTLRETTLPADAEKFSLTAGDFRAASAFHEADPPAAFAYGVKRALEGSPLTAVKDMTAAEARLAAAGAKAARAGMSERQRDFVAENQARTESPQRETLFAAEKMPDEEKKPVEGERTKVAPNVVRSAAILAAVKTLKTIDHELFDAPPAASEVPARVSAADMKAALDQVGKDWALDPAALEKYRAPVEKMARKLLAIARRQGSFDAALEYLNNPSARDAPTIKSQIRGSVESRDPDKIIISAKDAVRQAMRLREQGRSEGLREAVKLRQQFIEEASKYLTPEERGPLMKDLAAIGNENDLYARLQKLYAAYERAQKRRAVDDVRDLIRGADVKHLRPEFKTAMEELTGNLDDKSMSQRTRARAESLAAHMQSLSEEERAALPPRAQSLFERMGKEPLDSFSLTDLHALGDSIRAIVTQNQLKNRLIAGKHLRELAKVEKSVVHEVLKNNKALGTVGEEGKRKQLGDKSMLGKVVEFTDSPEVLAVSAGGEGGELHRHLYEELRRAENGHTTDLRRYRGELHALLQRHEMDAAKIIAWRNDTRRVALSELPARPPRRAAGGGLEALSDAEKQAREMRDFFDEPNGIKGPGGAVDGAEGSAAAAAGEQRSLELTGPEALSAWLYDQNPDARDKVLSNPVNLERFSGQSAENRTLQPGDLRTIVDTLTPFERELGELILRQNNELGEKIGGVHVALRGFDIAREENYFPLLTDQKQKRRVLDELAGQYADKWLEQSGFLKERVMHKVPVLLSDALDTHLWHMRQAVSFVNKAIPVRNARVLLGAPKVREVVDGHVGKTWTPRMERLLKDFSGAELGSRTEAEQLAAKLSRNAAAAVLGLRPTTVATNFLGAPLGLLTQMSPEESKAFARKFINLKSNTVDAGKYFETEIAPHNAYLADRYDPGGAMHRMAVVGGEESGAGGAAGGGAPGIPTAKTAAGQKWRDFQEWSLSWMNKAERAAVVAAHRAITELNPEWTGAQVGEHLEKMVRRTQNAVSSLDMSEFLRQTKRQPLMGLAFLFTNQASKLRDTLRLAALAYTRSQRSPADVRRLGASAALVFASAAVMPAMVRALWAQARGGFREDEAAKTKSIADYMAGAVADVADVAHPVIGDALRVLTSKDAAESVNSRALAQIAQGLRSAYSEARTALEPETRHKRELLPAVYRVLANLARGVSTFAGVPLDAPLSAAEGIGKAIAGRQPEFSLEQEARALRSRADPNAADPRKRRGDLSPAEFGRLQVLSRYVEQLHKLRQLEKDGRMAPDRADKLIGQLLAAAGRIPVAA